MAAARAARRGRRSSLAVLAAAGAAPRSALAVAAAAPRRARRASERALAQAREALLAYAADRPIDARRRPRLPALPRPRRRRLGRVHLRLARRATCGQAERLGRLPWKTLGLPDLRDGHGERLWYAVSTRYKGLLNCAASRACVDMSPARRARHDHRARRRRARAPRRHARRSRAPRRGGAAAVVIAPGPPLDARDGHEQRRDCAPGDCDARGRCIADPPRRAARCDPRNYLDAARAARTTPTSSTAATPRARQRATASSRARSRLPRRASR